MNIDEIPDPSIIRGIAERVCLAHRRRDYALGRHLLRPYPFTHPWRDAIDAECRRIAVEMYEARGGKEQR